MRALTIHQPWATLIIRGLKTAEYRSWKIPTGRLVIHAGRRQGASWDECELAAELLGGGITAEQVLFWTGQQPRGQALGTVAVVGHADATGPWAAFGRVANLLADPEEWAKPVRAIGQQGLWTWPPPAPAAGPRAGGQLLLW